MGAITFTGIELASAPMFLLMQMAGTVLAVVTVRFLYPQSQPAPKS